jgi:SAM-dependent methyltransferase
MHPDVYVLARAVEDEHWWFRGRRAILETVLERFHQPRPDATLLEIGCGNGGNLAMLHRFGHVWAIESDDASRRQAAARGVAAVLEAGWLPNSVPFSERHFDVVAMLDVLEHVAADRAALDAALQRLSPAGMLLITVPAYNWLWSQHDSVTHHVRRYTRTALRRLLESVGCNVEYISYFNTLLFPLALLRTAADRTPLRSRALTPMQLPPWPLNALFAAVFAAERHVVSRVALPFGVSLVAVARRAEASVHGAARLTTTL